MKRAVFLLVAATALVPGVAREQTLPLDVPAGEDIAQRIEVPVDRPGELVVDLAWEGTRSLTMWIEDARGRSLARWGGTSPGRLSVLVDESMADPDLPFVVRLRTIGRRGDVEGSITVRYPSLSDGPEPEETSPPEPAEPTAAVPASPSAASRWSDHPRAGTRWPRHLQRLEDHLDDDSRGLVLRALLRQVGGIVRGYADLGPALPPPVDPEGKPTQEELERTWALEDLGLQVSAMMRLADESGIGEDAATDLRRLLANVSELARRREAGGERAEGVEEALDALAGALEDLAGVADAETAAPGSAAPAGT